MSLGTAMARAQARKWKAGSTERGSSTWAMRCVANLRSSRADRSSGSAAARVACFGAGAGGACAHASGPAPARIPTKLRRLILTRPLWHSLKVPVLELGAEHELDPARRACSDGARVDDAADSPEAAADRRRIAGQGAEAAGRVAEDRVIEEIVSGGAKIQSQTLGEAEALLQGAIDFEHARPIGDVPPEIPPSSIGRRGEGGGIEPVIDGLAGGVDGCAGDEIRPLARGVAVGQSAGFAGHGDVHGQARAGGADARQLPAAQQGLSAPERQLVNRIGDEVVAHVDVAAGAVAGSAGHILKGDGLARSDGG